MIGVWSMVTFLYLTVYNGRGLLQAFIFFYKSLHPGYLVLATMKPYVYFFCFFFYFYFLTGMHNTYLYLCL